MFFKGDFQAFNSQRRRIKLHSSIIVVSNILLW